MPSSVLECTVSVGFTDYRRGDLLCDAVDVDTQLAAVRVGVKVVRTEDDIRVDGGDEPGDGNNCSRVCGLFGRMGMSDTYAT